MSDSLADSLRDLSAFFDEIGVRWYLSGAQAAALRGLARLSHDLDVTVFLGDLGAVEFADRLQDAGFPSNVDAELLSVAGVDVPTPTANHLVVMKLIAGRAKDLEAVADGIGEDGPRDAFAELLRRV